MIINNLCPVCEAKRVAGEDISEFTERLKIDVTPDVKTDVILVCIHEGDCSILDIGVCTVCNKRGFVVPPDDQNGICTDRDKVDQLEISLSEDDRGFFCEEHKAKKSCEKCGSAARRLYPVVLSSGTLEVCYSCKATFRPCRKCQTLTEYDETLETYICNNCAPLYTRCSCLAFVKKEVITQWDEDTKACPSCTHMTHCSWCNQVLPTKHTNDSYLCKTHWHMFKDVPYIEGYHHTKAKTFYKEVNEGKIKCYLGLEWEIQLNISNKKFPARTLNLRKRLLAGKIKAIFPDAECKRDGSLAVTWNRSRYENGVEVVWQPMSFDYISKRRDKFKDMFKATKSQLHRLMNESGMHIHISKAAFAPFHFLKFTNFFYTNEKQGFLYHIAGRAGNSYAKIKQSYSADGSKYSIKATGSRAALHFQQQKGKQLKLSRSRTFAPERYDVLNITNEHTFEIRAFKSPRVYEDFMANVEYVYAMYLYTKDVSQADMSLQDFFKFVTNNVGKFPELHKKVLTYKGGN